MGFRTAFGLMMSVCSVLLLSCASGGGDGTVCGNGDCEAGEDALTCPADCSSICGNANCESNETTQTCPGDCFCGNGSCDNGEDAAFCAQDCGTLTCGDSVCAATESTSTCAQDCYCGNGTCDNGETNALCAADCPTTATCGDGNCDLGETFANCSQDCHCGDGTCDPADGETVTTCAVDCDTGPCTVPTDPICDLYPQCGCQSTQKCTLDSANGRACVTAGSTAAAGHCTADTDCAAGTMCLGRSDTEGQCLSWCNDTADCSGGAGTYCTGLVDSTQTPITGASVCTIHCSPNSPSTACGAGFSCEIYEDSTTLALFTDCHGNVGTAQKGAACDDAATTPVYCATGLFCNSNLCYKWCVNSSECDSLETCDTAAFTTPLIIGTTQYGVCL